MSEEGMVELVQEALAARGIDEEVLAAGQFNPRGHTGGMFVGGLAGGDATAGLGGLAEGAGTVVGSMAGRRGVDALSGLPEWMLIGVTGANVYGFAVASRHKVPKDLAFQVPREGLKAEVHQRVNVRVLELVDEASGSRIELEGNRVPVTHSKDVINALT